MWEPRKTAERELFDSDHLEPDLVKTSVGNAQRRNIAAYVGRLFIFLSRRIARKTLTLPCVNSQYHKMNGGENGKDQCEFAGDSKRIA
jgi:hypothetical protein